MIRNSGEDSIGLDSLGLTPKTCDAFAKAGIKTVEDYNRSSIGDLLSYNGINDDMIDEVNNAKREISQDDSIIEYELNEKDLQKLRKMQLDWSAVERARHTGIRNNDDGWEPPVVHVDIGDE